VNDGPAVGRSSDIVVATADIDGRSPAAVQSRSRSTTPINRSIRKG